MVSGKLSDLSGLYAFSYFLYKWIPAPVQRIRWELAVKLLVLLGFAAINLDQTINDFYTRVFTGTLFGPVRGGTSDPTDLLALVVLLLPFAVKRKGYGNRAPFQNGLLFRSISILPISLALLSDTPPDTETPADTALVLYLATATDWIYLNTPEYRRVFTPDESLDFSWTFAGVEGSSDPDDSYPPGMYKSEAEEEGYRFCNFRLQIQDQDNNGSVLLEVDTTGTELALEAGTLLAGSFSWHVQMIHCNPGASGEVEPILSSPSNTSLFFILDSDG